MRRLLLIVFALVAIATIITCLIGKRFTLEAQQDLAVESYPQPGSTPIATLHKGERLVVLSCDDLKSYPAVHVRLPDRRDGYIIDYQFELTSVPAWDFSDSSPVSFTCPWP